MRRLGWGPRGGCGRRWAGPRCRWLVQLRCSAPPRPSGDQPSARRSPRRRHAHTGLLLPPLVAVLSDLRSELAYQSLVGPLPTLLLLFPPSHPQFRDLSLQSLPPAVSSTLTL